MTFRNYRDEDYEALCDFLIALNREDKRHINWNWARFEWMAEHPEFDKSARSSIGLWFSGERIVGAAIYDMYFGEGFCAALPENGALLPEILDYACRELRDDGGFGLALCDDDREGIETALGCGFAPAEQTETIMSIALDRPLEAKLPKGCRFAELDPVKEPDEFQWLLWQGFDHGEDRNAYERERVPIPRNRRHFDPRLSVAAVDERGEKLAYCCLWFRESTDYAYVEPVCAVPAARGKGVGRAVVQEALNRARALGAGTAYVISDLGFYERLGFRKERRYTFYWKK